MSDTPTPVEPRDYTGNFDAEDDGHSPSPKREWMTAHFGPAQTAGGSVSTAGGAVAAATGPRGPRRATATTGLDPELRHNWVSVGPRNVGGRIRALIVHPTNPNIMYAGSAGGGVWKTIDRAESWFPLWHDEASLSVGAMAICRANPRVIWAATGEILGDNGQGVFRSADDGSTWTQHLVPGGLQFDAIAAHPTNDQIAWAVGPNGIFRTSNAGVGWDHFRPGDAFSDVAYSVDAANKATLFLVRATNADVVFLASPEAAAGANPLPAAGTIRNLLPDAAPISPTVITAGLTPVPFPPFPAPALPTVIPPRAPLRGKIAIASGTPNTAYVRFEAGGPHAGIFRSDNARPAANTPGTAINWRRIFDGRDFDAQTFGQNFLTVATTPDGANLATGMNEMHVFANSNQATALAAPPGPATGWFRQAIAGALWAFDRGHHSDQDATVFAPDPAGEGGFALWAANDGGISRCLNWSTGIGHPANPTFPVPVRAISWQKRSEGILASQAYDLTQSQAHPSVYGCGFQDNGVFASNGGPSWQIIFGADGGSIAFDPDDPYRLIASEQEDVLEIFMPGLLNREVLRRGVSPVVWPRSLREGFFPADTALFVAETAYDPRRGRRVLHARQGVLYGRSATGGERWQPEPLGQGLELRRVAPAGRGTSLRIAPSAGAVKLGLVPQFARAEPQPIAVVRCQSLVEGPFALTDGDTVTFSIDGAAVQTVTFRSPAFADIGHATAAEVAAAINVVVPALAWAVVLADPTGTTVVSRMPGTNLTLGGTASLGPPNGTFVAAAGHHALLQLQAFGQDLTGQNLTITNGGPVSTATFNHLAKPATPSERALGKLLKAEFDPTLVVVGSVMPTIGVRVTHTAAPLIAPVAQRVILTGIAVGTPAAPATIGVSPVPNPPLPPAFAGPSLVLSGGPWNLSANPALTISDGVTATTFTFNPGVAVANLNAVTPAEVRTLLAAHLAGLAPAARPLVSVDLDLAAEGLGKVTEITFSDGDPNHAWAGDGRGVLYRSSDGATNWETIMVDEILDQQLEVEAIAIHPTDPDIVLVGLVTTRVDKPSLVFRSTNRGASWSRASGPADAAGQAVGITGLEFDTDHPDVVYASTDGGVFRSTNAGKDWAPINEGLPNCKAMDIVFEPTTRTLRVGTWGRGVYERHVGSRPPEDVRLLIRANPIDTGLRPPVRGPDLLSIPPGGFSSESPDIKVTRLLPVAAAGTLIDGVEFDERIAHEPPTPGQSDVLVQVHNFGAFPTTNVRVTVMWAALVGGRPPALPAGFAAARLAGTLALDSNQGPWRVIGDGTIPSDALGHDVVAAGQPRVHRLPYVWPATVSDQPRIGILAIVTGGGDDVLRTETDVEQLVVNERKAAYRETPTLRTDDDQRIVLRSTTGTTFRLGSPIGGLATATILGFTLGAAQLTHAASASRATFNLALGAPSGIRVQVDVTAIAGFDNTDNFPVTAATSNDVAVRMVRDFTAANTAASGGTAGPRVAVMATGASRVAVTGGSAAPTLGFAPNPNLQPFVTGTVNGPFNLSAGAPQDLQILVRQDVTLVFASVTVAPVGAAPEIPRTTQIANLAAARAFEIRAAINAQLLHSGIPLVAEPQRFSLVVRRSVTEESGRDQITGGEQYADIVASPVAVATVAARTALFDLVTVYATDRVRRDRANRLYLRSTNLGNVAVTNARHRVWSIDPTGALPLTPTVIDAPKTANLNPTDSPIVEFTWNPGTGAAGSHLLVLAIVDHDPDRVTDPPASFATLEALDEFCRSHPNAALRMIELSA